MRRHDVIIVGAGFAGILLARLLRRRGRRVALIERGRHPRFALGESTTPLFNLALERLAASYDLPDLHQLSTWGRWLSHWPGLGRGQKRGFTFYGHRRGEPYRNSAANEFRLLVAASPSAELADTHWLRSDVDHHWLRLALAEGVEYHDETELDGLEITADEIVVSGSQRGERRRFRAAWLVDGSGPGGFLARAVPLARGAPPPVESALLYAHFERPPSFVGLARAAGATLQPGPYPDERAAIHHLIEEGWVYVLPFDDGRVSAGIVLGAAAAASWRPRCAADPAAAWRELLAPYPTLAAQLGSARPVGEIRHLPRLPHRLARAAGERFALLPHAYAFFDPLFSTGMAWSLLAVERLAEVLDGSDPNPGISRYAALVEREATRIAQLLRAAWLAMDDFPLFAAMADLYFASVSFAEARQRLVPAQRQSTPAAWQGFLGVGDEVLDALFAEAVERLEAGRRDGFGEWIAAAIAPRNVAGLADPARRRLYPVDLEVLVERAELLGLDREEVRAALPRLRGEPAMPAPQPPSHVSSPRRFS